jgi:TDG/mug DNA glycosylase family protein
MDQSSIRPRLRCGAPRPSHRRLAARGHTLMPPKRPTRNELLASRDRRLRDLIAPDLTILFCGINPGLYSAAVGHHFARPGNRFWPALRSAGFTDRTLAPSEGRLLLTLGYGVTDIVARPSAQANEVTAAELVAGRRRLERKVRRYAPRWVAILGITAYRVAFGRPRAALGLQPERLGGASLWLLPNPSGLNASHQIADLARAFRRLRRAACEPSGSRTPEAP